MADIISHSSGGEFLLYRSPDGDVRVECLFTAESLWLPQKAIAELFGVEVPAISKHLSNLYDTKELARESTVSVLETVRQEGSRKVRRKMEYYSLDAIIAVGYRPKTGSDLHYSLVINDF